MKTQSIEFGHKKAPAEKEVKHAGALDNQKMYPQKIVTIKPKITTLQTVKETQKKPLSEA